MAFSKPCRPDLDAYMFGLLQVLKTRGTCPRRQTAAIVTDDHGHLLGTGYNGPPPGRSHCIDLPCPGAQDQSGDNSRCEAIHAEMNAIMQAQAHLDRATRLYCLASPCFTCAKLILCTNIDKVFCREVYADTRGLNMLLEEGVEVVLYDGEQHHVTYGGVVIHEGS